MDEVYTKCECLDFVRKRFMDIASELLKFEGSATAEKALEYLHGVEGADTQALAAGCITPSEYAKRIEEASKLIEKSKEIIERERKKLEEILRR
jgi:hypothetical protein